MIQKIVSFFMAIVAFFSSLFGIAPKDAKSYVYKDAHYGEGERQVLDLYVPKDVKNGRCGLVIFIHGGSWIAGDKSAYDESLLKKFSEEHKIAAARMNYRYLSESVKMSDIIDDISQALKTIKNIGEEVGINIDKVLLTGASAGAHLSLLYAYSMKETSAIKPACVVSYCGPTDFCDPYFYGNDLGDSIFYLMSYACGKLVIPDTILDCIPDLVAISPITYVNSDTVPTVIGHGMQDTIVPYTNAVTLDSKLTEAGVKHEFISFPNSGHGLEKDPKCLSRMEKLLYEYADTYVK